MFRSLYARVIGICLATVLVALMASLVVFLVVGRDRYRESMRAFGRVELELALLQYRVGGRTALQDYVTWLDRQFESVHYFVDASGIDLVTGDDRSALWPPVDNPREGISGAVSTVRSFVVGGPSVSVTRSPDGRYAMIAETSAWITAQAQLPYYLGILVIATVAHGLAAVHVIRTLRAITAVAEGFGAGDLGARVPDVTRTDEVGQLARAFNGMADRVSALVAAHKRLIQDISHEFRSPLARLAFATELSRTASDRNAAADDIRRQVDALSRLVSELLKLVSVEGSPHVDLTSTISMNDVVLRAVDLCRLNAEENHLRIVVFGQSQHLCLGDEMLLTRALDNLVRNAIQYSPQGQDVEVHVGDAGDAVVVTVRDYGCGVPEAMREEIFQPFVRVDTSRQFATGGAGLGLAIVKRIVVAHGATVRAENANPGLRISITVPAVKTIDGTIRTNVSAA